MNSKLRMTLIAGAIAALIAAPAWATSDTPKDGAQTPAKSELGQPERDQAITGPAMGAEPQMDVRTQGANVGTPLGDNPLYARSADDLDGVEVVDAAGDKVGKVKSIVLAPDGQSAHAVISAGGFLGLGAREILVSLDELRLVDDKLAMSATKEEVEALEDFTSEQYAELEGDQPISASISEFSAFEPGTDAPAPEAAPMTPETEAYKPEAAPETPKTQ